MIEKENVKDHFSTNNKNELDDVKSLSITLGFTTTYVKSTYVPLRAHPG